MQSCSDSKNFNYISTSYFNGFLKKNLIQFTYFDWYFYDMTYNILNENNSTSHHENESEIICIVTMYFTVQFLMQYPMDR